MQLRRSEGASRPLGQSPHRAVRQGAERVGRDFRLKDLYQSSKEFELMARAIGFGALAMLTLIPLLIVVAAASAATHHGIADWVVYGMGLTKSSARAVAQVFSAPARVLGTTSVFSALLLGLFGVTFAGSVQTGFERVWGLPAGPWHQIWRQAVWVAALIAYIYAAAQVASVTRHLPAETVSRVSVAVVLGIVFFWWGLRFLVGGRVSYLAALPGAVATVAFLAGLRAFSTLVFQPLIASNAVTYGAVGTVLIVQSWLIGVGWVIFGGQLFGRWFHDGWLKAWPDSRRGRGGPGRRGGARAGDRRPRHTAWASGGTPGSSLARSSTPPSSPASKALLGRLAVRLATLAKFFRHSGLHDHADRLAGASRETLVAFTAATAGLPGSSRFHRPIISHPASPARRQRRGKTSEA